MTGELLNERKKTLMVVINDKTYVPMKLKELAVLLSIPKTQRNDLREVMDALVTEGKVGIPKKGKYGKPETFPMTGMFCGRPKGFGLVTVEGSEQDVLIPGEKIGGVLHGDEVQIVVKSKNRGKRTEESVIRVLKHANERVIGYYQKNKSFGSVIPDNQKIRKDIFIPQGKDMGVVTEHKAVVKVTDFGGENKRPEGIATEIIGHVDDPGTDIISIIKAYGLPEEFPAEVMKSLERIPDEIDGKDMAGRLDLRKLKTTTIDGEDAKDLDDATTIEKKDGVYTLGVHIAGVSHYVTEKDPPDEEVLKQGASVYLADRVIPMPPHRLSNGICSLNEGTDRLALSCIMKIDVQGYLLGHEIAGTVTNVDRRMTYTAVNTVVTDRDESVMVEYRDLVDMFDLMKELAGILRVQRKKGGSIDFDFPESEIILNEKGKPVDIQPYEKSATTKIIEDFMLTVNGTAAEDYLWQETPSVYRAHDNPDPEKMKRLRTFINNFGYVTRTQQGEIHPKELQKLLNKIEGTPEEALINRLTLRSMRQAKYTTVCTGHFGPTVKHYTHFTSPIRRYPDLQIHRIIKENLRGGLGEKRIAHYDRILPGVTVTHSAMERRVGEAERETDKLKKCEYMSKRVGEEFDGAISGVINWRLYVELPNTVEGLIHVNELHGDYYIFDEERMELTGRLSRTTYKPDQKVRVQVSGTDKLSRTIDFCLAKDFDAESEAGQKN